MDKEALFREFVQEQLNTLPDAALAKFLKGREEHGDDPMDINVDDEIIQEVLDLLLYLIIRKYQRTHTN